jgi:homoserine kinase
MDNRIRVFAPASISNLGPGFDVLGLALDRPGDIIDAETSTTPGVQIVAITGEGGALSRDPSQNVAGVAAASVLDAVHRSKTGRLTAAGVRLWLHKGMPLASGLGSSGASSVAGAFAVNELLDRPLAPHDVLRAALDGERSSSGSAHADNVAPSLLGGLVLIRSSQPLDIVELPVPRNLWVAVVHPHCEVSTSAARALVAERTYTLAQAVRNLGNLGAFVAAVHTGDLALLARSVHDELVEPARAHLIPGFHQVKSAALEAGALGCSIAGSGPSVFAFSDGEEQARRLADVIRTTFRSEGKLDSDIFVGRAGAPGARRVEATWEP